MLDKNRSAEKQPPTTGNVLSTAPGEPSKRSGRPVRRGLFDQGSLVLGYIESFERNIRQRITGFFSGQYLRHSNTFIYNECL